MEQLIILLLVAIASAISGYYQNKKKREAEQRELDRAAAAPQKTAGEPPVPQWPRTKVDWQEELRRMLQGEMAPPQAPPRQPANIPPRLPPGRPGPPVARTSPPVLKPVTPQRSEGEAVFPSPLKQSSNAYARAAKLSGRIESRLEAIDAQTKAHRPAPAVRSVAPTGSAILKRWTQNRQSLREAFIASLIFAPPVGLTGRKEPGILE